MAKKLRSLCGKKGCKGFSIIINNIINIININAVFFCKKKHIMKIAFLTVNLENLSDIKNKYIKCIKHIKQNLIYFITGPFSLFSRNESQIYHRFCLHI